MVRAVDKADAMPTLSSAL